VLNTHLCRAVYRIGLLNENTHDSLRLTHQADLMKKNLSASIYIYLQYKLFNKVPVFCSISSMLINQCYTTGFFFPPLKLGRLVINILHKSELVFQEISKTFLAAAAAAKIKETAFTNPIFLCIKFVLYRMRCAVKIFEHFTKRNSR